MSLPKPPEQCSTCADYVRARKDVIIPAIARRAERDGQDASELAARYMARVHIRHLHGLPIA